MMPACFGSSGAGKKLTTADPESVTQFACFLSTKAATRL
jgi:hypothetical protein